MPEMELEVYQLRADVYIVLRGRVVLEECDRLKSTVLPLIRKGVEQVFLDLSKVEYIDSAGLGVLVGFKMTASKNRSRIVLIQPSRPVADILYISKLDGIFDILTGAEADLLKTQMQQPQNRIGLAPGEKQMVGEASSGTQPGVGRVGVGITPKPVTSSPAPDRFEIPGAVSPELPPQRPIEQPFAASVRGGEERSAEHDSFASLDGTVRSQKEMIEEHCRKAVEYMRVSNYDMAVLEYERALRIDPEYLPALNNLAIVYEKQPSWIPKAIEQWEIVARISQQRGDQKHLDRAKRHLANLRKIQS